MDFVETPQHLMQMCDVVVLTSRDETFGLVLIEAMSVGTAVVGSRAGGVPEIIEEGRSGLLFEPENAQHLSEKLAALYLDPERTRALGAEGTRMAAEKFNAGKHYDALENWMEKPPAN